MCLLLLLRGAGAVSPTYEKFSVVIPIADTGGVMCVIETMVFISCSQTRIRVEKCAESLRDVYAANMLHM